MLKSLANFMFAGLLSIYTERGSFFDILRKSVCIFRFLSIFTSQILLNPFLNPKNPDSIMSELALQRIREAKEQRLTRLDIGNCGLTEIPDEVFELTWLEDK